MKQYGDITKLSGHDLDPVDLIVGGSPCQDLSVAGKRKGLEGERSGLFLEMIRIIREMREKTNGEYPKFALWENVSGATSSNNGRDFGTVLGEFARLIEPGSPDVPVPEEGWSKAGVLLVSNGQIAWRTHDAQYWGRTIRDSRTGDVLQMGTPQRRRRISLVADLRGQSAAEILFERKGVSGDFGESEAQREDPAKSIGRSIDGTVSTAREREREREIVGALCARDYKGPSSDDLTNGKLVVDKVYCIQGNCIDRSDSAGCNGKGWTEDMSFTLNTIDRPAVYKSEPLMIEMQSTKNTIIEDGISPTMTARQGTGGNQVNAVMIKADDDPVSIGNGQLNQITMSDKANALDTMHDQQAVLSNVVRRLTPLECERLQGYPDGWTDIPGASDSKRYMALGNSLAIPFWSHLAKRFAQYGEVKTIGSLFDGIGGFPLVFKRAGAETLWTSEIEPFCEKVVKHHLEKGDL